MARLEEIKEVAERFVLVRLTRIDDLDLNLFEFDYDLTMMIFFLDARERVYARYGGRDATDADNRQSLAGLRYTMQSVLEMHGRDERLSESATGAARKEFASKSQPTPRFIRDSEGGGSFGGRGCMHCHQVKEALNSDLQRSGQWTRDMAFRYPLPENVGLELEVDRGNHVKRVMAKSPAAAIGLQPGDVLRRLNGVPVHSFGDAQYALDRAPGAGSVEISWQRGEETRKGELRLLPGWRKTDLTWRTSTQRLLAAGRLYGKNLSAAEKKALGLFPSQLAFRHQEKVSAQAAAAGVQAGDIILGVDDQKLEMSATELAYYIRRNYLVGDTLTVNLLRDGRRLSLPMKLLR